MKDKEQVKSEDNINQKSTILGTFSGECADANITNKNGLDITRDVWENVFSSEDYKKAIELGHYIGFLGHPEDPNCMDFEHACIVMKEGHIEDDGKIYGSFDLIDTPVGRIVKAFQDAGVQFGISVRGAGDIIDNSVDPETFVFRGFDLVSFPAYPDAIPKFTEIAASSDIETQKKYKVICAAVKDNLDSLNTCEAVDIVQSQFAKQSDEYDMLEKRKEEIESNTNIEADDVLDISNQKIEGLTQLYIEAQTKIKNLEKQISIMKSSMNDITVTANRKISGFKRIYSNQDQNYKKIKADYESKLADITQSYNEEKQKIKKLKADNLKYKHQVKSADERIEQKDSIISDLNTKYDETVTGSEEMKRKAANLDAKVHNLESKIEACQQIIQDYQDAYGNMYANALGVHIDNMSINASTSVEDLQSIIKGAMTKDSMVRDSKLLNSENDIFIDDPIDDNDIVTI